MQLNQRHKVGLFLTIVIVGVGLLSDASVKESVGVALLGLAATWLIGALTLRKQAPHVGAPEQAPVIITPGLVPQPAPIQNERQGRDAGNPAVPTSHAGSWTWLVVSATSFSVLLSLAVFNLTWQSITGEPEKAGESFGRMLIPLIALGFAARSTWKSLLAKEPEDNPFYRRRHRRFNLTGAICTALLLSSAFGLGVIAGNRIQRNKKLDATLVEIGKLGPKGAELRAQIKETLSQDAPTFQDYYVRCLKLEKVLDEYDMQQQRIRPLLSAFLAEAADHPKLIETAQTVQRINDKDAEVVKLFRLEIAKGKEVIMLPPSQQTSFYREQIIPLEREATRVADEEITMMREAQQKGLQWPSDVKELIKQDK